MRLIRTFVARLRESYHHRLALAAAVAIALVALATLLDAERPGSVPASSSVLAPQPHPAPDVQVPSSAKHAVGANFDVSDAGGETQICGEQWVKQDVDGHADAEQAQRAALAATAKRAGGIAEAMSRSGDERTRAVADLVASLGSFTPDTACEEGSPCALARVADPAQAMAHRHHLLEVARTTSDPQVYAWAYQTCYSPLWAADEACASLDATQWARLDPSNAVAWLAVSGAASRRHDPSAVDDAMFHVANAARYDDGENVAAALVIDSLPHDSEALLAGLPLASALTGRDWAWQMDAARGARRYCDVRELDDGNRRQVCSRIGESMLAHSKSLLPWFIGRMIGRGLDWPLARQRALDEELAAFKLVQMRGVVEPAADPYSCSGLRKTLGNLRETARIGEVEKLRRAVLATGKPMSRLADEFAAARAEDTSARPALSQSLVASTTDAASASSATGAATH